MSRLSTHSDAAAKERRSVISPNPIMRRLTNVNDVDESDASTYRGIALKTVYFLLFSVAGIILQAVIKPLLSTGQIYEVNYKGFEFSMYATEAWVLIGVTIAAVVFQLLAFFARPTTPVTGALYSVTQGYFIAFIVFTILPADYRYLGLLALAITMMIILVMSILYATGAIRVNKKFRMVMLTLIITSVGASLLMLIGSFIPATRGLVAQIGSNYPIAIIFGVIFIIIAALFLICDFNTIDNVVNNKMAKKYEWSAAFGLSFTVLWLYLKVLDLIITIAGSKRD